MAFYLAGLQSIPAELDEAAAVDGASAWKTFRRVTFPLLAPAATVSVSMTSVLGLRVFDQVMALTRGGPGMPPKRSRPKSSSRHSSMVVSGMAPPLP